METKFDMKSSQSFNRTTSTHNCSVHL